METKKASFIKSITSMKDYPHMHLPEIVIAGKSNVGKSSFINALANNGKLARISSTPGKTRTINLYHFHDGFMLVDLPGYGYAEVSKTEKEAWAGYIEEYLSTSQNIALVVILVDIRHQPTANDIIMLQFARSTSLPMLVVASKCDKISKAERSKRLFAIQKALNLGANDILPFSSVSREGLQPVWARLLASIQISRIHDAPPRG